jgi:hypothetical protein
MKGTQDYIPQKACHLGPGLAYETYNPRLSRRVLRSASHALRERFLKHAAAAVLLELANEDPQLMLAVDCADYRNQGSGLDAKHDGRKQ